MTILYHYKHQLSIPLQIQNQIMSAIPDTNSQSLQQLPTLTSNTQSSPIDGKEEQKVIMDSAQQKDDIHRVKQMKKGGNRRYKETQSLKEIANTIRSLIGSYGELSIKDLSYFLYEIVSNTQLGMEIARGSQICKRQLAQLEDKYGDEERCNQTFMAKNIRRRLYDVLNVMISAGIISRNRKTLSLSRHYLSDPTYKQKMQMECLQPIKDMVYKKKIILAKKSKKLEMIAKKYLQLQKLHKQNTNAQKGDAIQMPMVMMLLEPKSRLKIQGRAVEVQSCNQFKVWTEMDLIPKLYQVTKSEIQSLLHH